MGDAAVESFELTLQCPVSLMRIHVPGRGVRCKHLQCFDLATYLRMRDTSYLSSLSNVTLQTTPPWSCPICGLGLERRSADLRIDEYFAVLLETYEQDTVKVKVLADGTHHPVAVRHECQEETVIRSDSPCPTTHEEAKPSGRACNAKRVKVEHLADYSFDHLRSLPQSVDAMSTEFEEAFEETVNAAEATPSIRHVSAIPACHVRSRTVVKPEPQVQTNAGRLPGMGQAEASANRTASPENVTTCSGYAEPWTFNEFIERKCYDSCSSVDEAVYTS
ncbi:zinc finger protein [Aphelenchoides avenae]|nr:zinc finger protein [Aphelenchus avenae]